MEWLKPMSVKSAFNKLMVWAKRRKEPDPTLPRHLYKPIWPPPTPNPPKPLFAPPPVFFTTEEKLTEKQIETMKNEILKNFKKVGHKMLVLEPTTDTKWTSAIGEKNEPKKDPERKITY